MSLRERLDQNAPAAIALALIATAAAGFFLVRAVFWPGGDSEPSWTTMAYFYDQNTGQLFELPAQTVGPVETDSGPYRGMPAGVRANVFACGQCSQESKRFVGWLEAPQTAVPADAIAGQPAADQEVDPDEGVVIRRPSDEKWVYPSSLQGQQIVAQVQSRCPSGSRPNYCRPPSRPR